MLLTEVGPDIIMISETWLSTDVPDSHLMLNKYSIFRQDRDNGNNRHGGVMVAVLHDLNPLRVSGASDHEICFVDVTMDNESIRLGVVYRPPSASPATSSALYQEIARYVNVNMNVYLAGDINLPLIDWSDYIGCSQNDNLFIDFVNENGLYQHVSDPTRDNNILDLVLSNCETSLCNVAVHETFSQSDHCYITFEINHKIQLENKTVIDYKNADWELLRAHLATLDWDRIFSTNNNVEEMWDSFRNIIQNMINLYIPVKTISSRSKNAPWFNNHLKRITRTKKRKWKKYKRWRTRRHLADYNRYCKYVHKEVICARSKYEKQKFIRKQAEPKSFFNYIDNRTNGRKPIATLNVGDTQIVSNHGKATALGTHYQSVFTRDNGVLPPFDARMPPDSLTDIQITENCIVKSIKEMNGNGSAGVDEIHPKFFKNVYPYLIKPLKILFNACLGEGVLPAEWKFGIICPVYKNNFKPNLCSSYRPICLTVSVCKIFERIIRKKLLSYFLENFLLSAAQHGFLPGRSTLSNLLLCINEWTKALDDKRFIDILYLDQSKAFDTVSHRKLLYKLKLYGIGGKFLSLIENFLTGRYQSVRVGNCLSPPSPVTSGIPQGTLLGPLFFIIFLNDISDVLQYTKMVLYADDAKIFKVCSSPEDCYDVVEDISAIADWMEAWQMKLNIEKTEVLSIGRPNARYPFDIQGTPLRRPEFCKDLGIYVTCDLKPSYHCATIARRTHFRRRQFQLAFVCKDRNFQVFLFSTYIRPMVEYNSSIWSPYLLRDIDKIEDIQRKFTKYLPGLYNLSYRDRLDILGLETLEERRIKTDLILLFKIVHGLVHCNQEEFITFSSAPTRGHPLKLMVQHSRLEVRKNYFVNRTIPIWNSLPSKESYLVIPFINLKIHYQM